MADAAGTHNDGGVAFGSQVVSITTEFDAAQNYIAEAFNLTKGSNWNVRNNEKGVPNAQFGKVEVPTGTLTLQLADENVKLPKMFARFDAIEQGGATTKLVVSEVGQAFTHEGETKVNISVRKVLNPNP